MWLDANAAQVTQEALIPARLSHLIFRAAKSAASCQEPLFFSATKSAARNVRTKLAKAADSVEHFTKAPCRVTSFFSIAAAKRRFAVKDARDF